jgi:hypothetical protein
MRALIIAVMVAATPAGAQVPDGYTWGTDSNGKPFWVQCQPDGYCYGRQGANGDPSPDLGFYRITPSRPVPRDKPR